MDAVLLGTDVQSTTVAEPKVPPLTFRSETNLLHEMIMSIGIPPNIRGYAFIIYSLELILENPNYMYSVTKGLYIDVAKHFHTRATCVERAIRFAINNAWTYGNIEYINSIFQNCVRVGKDVPTNSVFLARLYYYIINKEYYR